MFKRILVPVDGSETSTRALATALELARDSGARVRLLHVIDVLNYAIPVDSYHVLEAARKGATRMLEDAMAMATASGVPADSYMAEQALRLGEGGAEEARKGDAGRGVGAARGGGGGPRRVRGGAAGRVRGLAGVPVRTVRLRGPREGC